MVCVCTFFLLLVDGGQKAIGSCKARFQENSHLEMIDFGLMSILVELTILTETYKFSNIWLIGINPEWVL